MSVKRIIGLNFTKTLKLKMKHQVIRLVFIKCTKLYISAFRMEDF